MNTDHEQAPWLTEVRRKMSTLDGRDLQLWFINALVILTMAAGFLALIFPNVMWNLRTLRLDSRYVPQLFFSLTVLIILFNIYILEQRRVLQSTRNELFRQMFRAEAAEASSLVDPVTEIFSRRYLRPLLAKEVSRADRQGSHLTFLLVDIDDFRSVNTRFGQLMGDRLLNSVGQLLLSTLRGSDAVVRYGGDEFLVLLPETNEQQAEHAVERVLRKVDHWNRESSLAGYRLSLSCGLATYTKGADPMKLLEAAEQRKNLHRAARSAAG